MINKTILRTIQSGKEKEWYNAVTEAALYMATGGFLKKANELLQALWKYNLDHDRTTWIADNAFEVLWYAAKERPDYVPFGKTDIDQLELNFRSYCTGLDSISSEDILQSLAAIDLSKFGIESLDIESINLPVGTPGPYSPAAVKNNKMPDAFKELESLALLENHLADTATMANYEFCNATSLAAELAAKNNNIPLAVTMAKLWATNYHERYLGYNFSKMANNRHVAPLLLQGIIADELKLSDAKCKTWVTDIIKAIDERMEKGDSLVYGELTWKELIKKLSILSIKNAPELFNEKQKEEEWIGYTPPSPQSIQLTEQRLGLELPQDFKEFLLVSNGLPEFPIVNPPLLKIEEIDFLNNFYSKFNQADILDIIKKYSDEDGGTIEKFVDNAICISQFPDEQEIWLIHPFDNNEWQTWFFAAWVPGEHRYKSFRHFIEEQIQQLEND